MRAAVANWLVGLANHLHPTMKFEHTPKDKFDTIERAKVLIDRLNGTMYQIPRKYYLWTDWTTKPAKLILCEHQRGPREVVYPERPPVLHPIKDASNG